MTGGSVIASNSLSQKTGSAHQPAQRHHPVRSPSDRHSSLAKSPSPSPDTLKKSSPSSSRGLNGDASHKNGNGQDDSEAETVHLSDAGQGKTKGKKRVVKHEHREDIDASSPSLTARSELSRSNVASRASSVNGDATDKRERKTNGVDKRENGHAKSSVREKSRLSNDVGSAASRAQSADASTSPPDHDDRSRHAQSAEPRKRKFSDSVRPSKLEPPRQRPRLEDPIKGVSKTHQKTRATSPPTPATPVIRSHKRSASTQSSLPTISSGVQSRKRREASTNTIPSDRRDWQSDSFSDTDSNRPPPIPSLAPPRSSRSSHRALASPARVTPHGSKRADKYGTTPFAKACERGSLDAVKTAYEEAPSELDQADNGGFAPLQKAALGGYTDVVQFLINKGCRKDCHSKDEHDTPLIDAVENGHLDVVKILLDSGVNPHHQNKQGKRAIDAIDEDEDYADEMKALLQKAMQNYQGSDSDDEDDGHDPPVITREDKNRTDLLYLEPNRQNLLDYSRKGDVVAVDHFLSSVKPDNACAVAAARGGHNLVLNLLLASAGDRLEKDPDPAKYEETPLLAAIGRGHLKVIRLLLMQENFNPTRKTRDGKTYFELAEQMRGPKWQIERDLLKEHYDLWVTKRKAVVAAKKRKLAEAGKMGEPASRISKDADSPRATKHKRLLSRKELPVKDAAKRRSRPVAESSQSEGSDDEVRMPKKQMRRRKGSIAGKTFKDDLPSPGASRQVSGSKPRSSIELKPVKDHVKVAVARKTSSEKKPSADMEMNDAPPVKQDTPEPVREARRREEAAEAAEAQRKKEEAEQKKEEAERKKREEVERKEEAERKRREAEEAAIEEAKRKAEEAARVEEDRLRKEQEERERMERLDALPTALRVAVEKGRNRPLHFSPATKDQAEELGIGMQFLPIYLVPLRQIDPECDEARKEERWMMSFHVVGILALPSELRMTEFSDWEKRPVTDKQRDLFLRFYDLSQLAQEYRWPQAGEAGYNYETVRTGLAETRQKFLRMEPLNWIKHVDFEEALKQPKYKHLEGLRMRTSSCCRIAEIEDFSKDFDMMFDEDEPKPVDNDDAKTDGEKTNTLDDVAKDQEMVDAA